MGTKEKYIKFSDLQFALGVSNARELEDLIIESIYQNLIVGSMDQANQCLIVESCACRDCRDQDIDYIIDTLSNWHESAQHMLGSLEDMVQYSHDSFEKNKTANEELVKIIQTTRDN